jgi:hypothetical protein
MFLQLLRGAGLTPHPGREAELGCPQGCGIRQTFEWSTAMHTKPAAQFCAVTMLVVSVLICSGCAWRAALAQDTGKTFSEAADQYARQLLKEGKQTFRLDTFGSEDFWGGKLKLHQAIQGEKLGGTGPGVSPKKRLSLVSRSTWKRCRRKSRRRLRPAKLT